MKAKDIKRIVKEKYGKLASRRGPIKLESCCSGSACCSDALFKSFSDDYGKLPGYLPEADLGLGCGLPTEFAGIKNGDHVLDLGSGAGNDCFVARALAGETGRVVGLDFTDEMLEKARENAAKLQYGNVEFVKGDIEAIPLPDNSFDVVISNCVLNLVPDKQKAYREIFRVLKPGGHFCISDVVLSGELPDKLKEAAEVYAGCVAGAMRKEKYLEVIALENFTNLTVQKEKQIVLSDEILSNFLSKEEIENFKASNLGIYSLTITAQK